MRLLITGASGYLGKAICSELFSSEHKITTISRKSTSVDYNCDLTDSSKSRLLLQKINPERIIHCAAFVPKNTIKVSINIIKKYTIFVITVLY